MVLRVQSRDLYSILGKSPGEEGYLNPDLVHSAYNALDSAVTLRVHHALRARIESANTPHAANAYHFTRAMQGPALAMMRRGVAVNQQVRQDETARYQRTRDEAQALLDDLADAVWGPESYEIVDKHVELYQPVGKRGQLLQSRQRTVRTVRMAERPRGLNAGSGKQCLAFFNLALQRPVEYEVRKTALGRERTPTANDKALRKWGEQRTKGPGIHPRDASVYPVQLARPFVSLILTIREMDKNLQVLKSPLEPNSRISCSYNVAGTENWRWSSSANAFGRGCVLAETEVLTPSGWKRIDEIQPNDQVMQWDNGVAEWCPATPFTTHYEGKLYKVEGDQIHQELTSQHRVLTFSAKGTRTVEPAERTATRSQAYIPVAANFYGDNEAPAFWAMLMADGSFEHGGWRLAFKKQRKINRFLYLAKHFNFEYTEQSAHEGYRRFAVPGFAHVPKHYGPWVLDLRQSDLRALVEEARHWDGHDRGSGFIFYTANKSCAEWFAIAAHLCERGTTTRLMQQSENSYSDTPMWCVNVKTRHLAQVMRKHWTSRNYSGPVYCLTVDSGFFFIRSNGKVSVTGNTNLQNITASMRRMFCADDGYRMISTDLEQAESYVVAGLVWEVTGDDTYWHAILSGDLHTTVCRMAWPEKGWNDEKAHDRAIADSAYPGLGMSYRDVAKRIGHGSNYNGSSFGIAAAVGIPRDVVEDFQRRYFLAFPAIRQWHAWVKDQLLAHQYLDTPLGTRRWFFSRPTEDSTLREAIACVPQGTVAKLLNLIMWKCWARSLPGDPLHTSKPHLPIELLLQNHDAFLFQTPITSPLPAIISEVNSEFLTTPITFVRGGEQRTMNIPGEFVTGFNWAYQDKDPNRDNWTFTDGNPDGLTKWRGEDSRIRQQGASPSLGDWLGRPR